jgi:hypothetical protein
MLLLDRFSDPDNLQYLALKHRRRKKRIRGRQGSYSWFLGIIHSYAPSSAPEE